MNNLNIGVCVAVVLPVINRPQCSGINLQWTATVCVAIIQLPTNISATYNCLIRRVRTPSLKAELTT